MKITIYELLGLVKDDKEPERIKYNGFYWDWTGDDYKRNSASEIFLFTSQHYVWFTDFLNDTVEILEEEKKDNFTGWKMYQDGKEVCSMDCSVEEKKIPEKLNKDRYIGTDLSVEDDMFNKINSIIDYLKSKGE